jgi:arylsulfatase A-like enzyme
MIILFGVCSYAAIENCDFSSPKDGDVDGRDLAQFAAFYADGDPAANVDGDGDVDAADAAHFAGHFGESYVVAAQRPNILLIIADDVGLDMVTGKDLPSDDPIPGIYPGLLDEIYDLYINHDPVHASAGDIYGKPASTPALDQLARGGMVFSNAWAQPFCSPTRATIITGMFMRKHNVQTFDESMTTNHITFVQRLRDEANYSTAIFGKWHLAGGNMSGYGTAMPQTLGFEIFKGNLDSAPTPGYWDHYYHVQDESTVNPEAKPANTPIDTLGRTWSLPGVAPTTFAPVVRAADTIEWITAKKAADPDKPWFAWLAFNEAHVSVQTQKYYHVPNEDMLDQATRDEIEGCLNPDNDPSWTWPQWNPAEPNYPDGVYLNGTEGYCTAAQLMRAMTNAMDTAIGKVLDEIDANHPNTYVIFIGDNGTWANNIDNLYLTIGGRGKTTPYESGSHVPLAIRGPDITANTWSDEHVHAADLFSTCLELAGLEVKPAELVYRDFNGAPAELDGVSLNPILFDAATFVRDPDYGYLLEEVGYNSTRVGARNATYKVIRQTTTPNYLFYNLEEDPLEEYDLPKPGDCTNYNTIYNPEDDPEWHYCYLLEVIDNHSIFNPILPDTTGPAVTIDQAVGQDDPASTSPINFTVVFSEPVGDFATGDVTIGGDAGAETAAVTEVAPNDGTTYNVAVSGMTGAGTVIVSIAAGAAQDAAGNPNSASTSSDNMVTYASTDPTISLAGTPLSAFSSQPGIPSAVQSYTVSGINLTANISIAAPTDFEISTSSDSGFGPALTLIQSGGSVAATDIFVRFNRATEGTSSDNIAHTSTGATQRNVAVSGTASNFAVDGAVSMGSAPNDENGVISIDVPHTTGTGDNRLMLVGVSWNCGNGEEGGPNVNWDILSASFTPDGEPSIDLVEVITQDPSSPDLYPRYAAIYGLTAPPPGVTGTVTINFEGGILRGVVVGVINFAGVDQTTPIVTSGGANGAQDPPTVELTGLGGDELILDNLFMGSDGLSQTVTAGAEQSPQWSHLIDGHMVGAASIKEATGSSVTMSWTYDEVRYWAIVAVAINPASVP